MNEKDILFLRQWFKDYVKGFLTGDSYNDENIHVKEHHSYRVCKHCISISQSLNLPGEKVYLAEIIGLFHDVGRFRQFKTYRTFNDKKSENHSQLGLRVLKEEETLSFLPLPEQDIIVKSIERHSFKELPADEKEEVLFFTKIIRDADKLDILNVLTEYYYSAKFGSNPALDLDMPDSPEISDAVVEDIMNNRCVDLKHVRTINDFKILQTSWVFDISFPYALQYIAEKKYVEKIIGVLPREPVVARVHAHINDFLGCVTKN